VLRVVLILGLAGCWPTTSSNTDAGTFGFGAPTLQITVGQAQFGPSAPDSGSYVDVVRDASIGRAYTQIVASSAASGAGCNLYFERDGAGVQAIGVGQYALSTTPTSTTISPGAGEGVTVPGYSFHCYGTDCNGAYFTLSALDATHAEGYFTGNVTDDGGQGTTSTVIDFYLPVRTYSP
jgi:hypothetical protein